ncbi:primosomal protein N' (replication factor Y) [Paenarthrobacter nicotinovorans]|uniref:primosomal protein N' n=1 Tax=Micrococcaceae TaxID=1268 RepID=UPI00087633CE|nr:MULTISPECIES: primosomal protein N' [Micrococcaceae]MDR6436229.1 primosomal protein N' (replication factor Y) [Paenarthrobacter nicotinovorans]SCZ58222.1 replication restart DNA helicase PriA [Arthrobacter sp. UNCCL28]
MAGHEAQSSLLQPSLLQGFPDRAPVNGPPLAAENPVARVILESSLPHLDRPFDYSVPAELSEDASPGVRVKVKFNGQELNGYILERRADSDAAGPLSTLHKVVSPVAVLTPAVSELASTVAARYAGTLSDVLRTAIPPRVAKVEKELLAGELASGVAELKPLADGRAWANYSNGPSYLQHLAGGGSPKAVLTALQGFGPGGWPALVASAVATVRSSGRGAVVVVPDYRDLEQLENALAKVLPSSDIARLAADDGQTPRYRNFLRLLSGSAGVAVGTRSAAYAPVQDLGLVVCWDDGDDLHIEQRAPYAHTREVLLLRAEQANAAGLMASHSRSTELQRLVEMQWAVPIEAPRTVARSIVPRVLNTADSFEQERDPLAKIARLPGAAWRAAKEALERGPVLVQVARAGYAPSLVCETCRELARCNACQGPLAISSGTAIPACKWCSTPAPQWRCNHCSGTRLRKGATGVMRTAEELGRAFPGKAVVTSSGEHIKATVPDAPALVVATVGAEPIAPHGYAAALLLDGNSLLRRENLRAGEDTVRRWFNAAALVKPAREGGLVVITADDTAATGALLRWDAPGFASRELALRKELQLPPAVRVASVTGARADVAHFAEAFDASTSPGTKLRSAGPAPVQLFSGSQSPVAAPEAEVRMLYFIPYADAAETTRAMRALKAANAAKRTSGPVQLRLDGVDVL